MTALKTERSGEGTQSMSTEAENLAPPVHDGRSLAPEVLDEVIEGTARLLDLVRLSPVSRLSLAVGSVRWEIETSVPTAAPVGPQTHLAVPAVVAEPAGPVEPVPTPGHGVLAPLVGVFYSSARPGTPPFVRVGDRVEAGQQLAIIEAMKMMNEIVADRSGIVREVHTQNEAIVEFGERLFTLEPV